MVFKLSQLPHVGVPLEFQEEILLQVAVGGLQNCRYFSPTGFWTHQENIVTLVLPESVAEQYRQEGRRQLQSELRNILGAARR